MSFLKKDEGKYLGLFYTHTVLESTFAVVWIYWIVYLLDQGFSYQVIGAALAVNGLSMAILEVPTGALADAVSRKLSVLAGLIGFALVLLIIPLITNPLVLIGVFAVWGFPITLVSGAAEAWVVDNLRAEHREDLIKEYYVKNTSLRSFGAILAALLSGLVVSVFSMDALWYLYGAATLMSVVILGIQTEHFERKKIHIRKSFSETYSKIREGARFTVQEKNVLYIMIASFFIVTGSELTLICSKPFLEVLSVPREYFGYLSAAGAALCVGMPFIARRLAELFKKEKHYLSVHSLVFGAVIATVILARTPVIAAAFLMVILLRNAMVSPVVEPFFQEFLPQQLRATVGSFRNMVTSIALLVGDCVIAGVTDTAGPQMMVALGGIIMLPAAVFYMSIHGNQHHK